MGEGRVSAFTNSLYFLLHNYVEILIIEHPRIQAICICPAYIQIGSDLLPSPYSMGWIKGHFLYINLIRALYLIGSGSLCNVFSSDAAAPLCQCSGCQQSWTGYQGGTEIWRIVCSGQGEHNNTHTRTRYPFRYIQYSDLTINI